MLLAVRFYDVVLSLHVMAIVIAFGAPFAYLVGVPYVRRTHPGAMSAVHAMQAKVGQRVIAPVGGVALLLGAYLASDIDAWSEVWVTIPLVILIVLLGVGGAVMGPLETKLSGLAEAPGTASPEYEAGYGRLMALTRVLVLLVLVAIFFMVTKAGG